MCDPLTIAGAALSVGSAVANSSAASKVARARDGVLRSERARQQAYDAEAQTINTRSQDRFQGFGGQQDQRAQALGDYFAGQQSGQPGIGEANTGATAPQSSSAITVQEEGAQRDRAREFTDRQGRALGGLRAFGDLLGGISREQARDAGLVGQIGGFKRGSSAVVPLELEAAGQAGQKMRMLGDLLGGAGQLAVGAGLRGANPFGMFSGAAPAAAGSVAPASPFGLAAPAVVTSRPLPSILTPYVRGPR
jgi:hypothetical protein